MNDVWLVSTGAYSDYGIVCVHSARDEAMACAERLAPRSGPRLRVTGMRWESEAGRGVLYADESWERSGEWTVPRKECLDIQVERYQVDQCSVPGVERGSGITDTVGGVTRSDSGV